MSGGKAAKWKRDSGAPLSLALSCDAIPQASASLSDLFYRAMSSNIWHEITLLSSAMNPS